MGKYLAPGILLDYMHTGLGGAATHTAQGQVLACCLPSQHRTGFASLNFCFSTIHEPHRSI